MTNQIELFHEDVYSAIRTDIMACGGNKIIGSKLWPEKPVDKSGELLANCLNTTRPEKLDPEQIKFIVCEAKQHGSYAYMTYIAQECGFSNPEPIEPEDERAKLQRQFIESTKTIAVMAKRIEELSK